MSQNIGNNNTDCQNINDSYNTKTTNVPTTILLPMIGLNYWTGYHPWILAYGIPIFKSVVLSMPENGLYGLRNSADGLDLVGKLKVVVPCCFAMEIPVPARHLLGNKDCSPERSESLLISCNDSSLVVDRLCD